jgi:hypothetical protein
MVAEEPAERMNDHNVERRRLGCPGFDHALELGTAVIGCRCARFDISLDELVAARLAVRACLWISAGQSVRFR